MGTLLLTAFDLIPATNTWSQTKTLRIFVHYIKDVG